MSPEPVIPPTAAANKLTDAIEVIAKVAADATPPAVPSPPGSMAGFSFLTLLRKNKDKVKLLVAAVGGYLSTLVTQIKDPNLSALVATAIGVVVYIAASAVDYWLTDGPG